ncbi:MAG: hypothetical protein QM808_11150 [Steroidobacteraceae bacterium]
MVIGTSTELRSVATTLLNGLEGKAEKSSATWPEMVAQYSDVQDLDQGLSFHLETSSRDQPRKKFGDTEFGKTLFLVFAIVGFIATIRWIVAHAL